MNNSPPFKKPRHNNEAPPPIVSISSSSSSSNASSSSGSVQITNVEKDDTIFKPPTESSVGVVGYGKLSVAHPADNSNPENSLDFSRPVVMSSCDVPGITDVCNFFSFLNLLWLDTLDRMRTNNLRIIVPQFQQQQQQHQQLKYPLPNLTDGDKNFIRKFNIILMLMVEDANNGKLQTQDLFHSFLDLCSSPKNLVSYKGIGDQLIYRHLEPISSVGLEFKCPSCGITELVLASQLQLVDNDWNLHCLRTMNDDDHSVLPKNVPTFANHRHACKSCTLENLQATRLMIRNTTYFVMFQVVGAKKDNLLDQALHQNQPWDLLPEHFTAVNLDTGKLQLMELSGVEIKLSCIRDKKTGEPIELSHVLMLKWFSGRWALADDLGRRRTHCLLRSASWSNLCVRFLVGLNNFGVGYNAENICIHRVFYSPVSSLMDPEMTVARKLEF